jgi:urease accessory protein
MIRDLLREHPRCRSASCPTTGMALRHVAHIVVLACMIAPACNAYAHELVGDAGLQAGLVHPLSGLDHLLAMIAVGMVSVVLGGSAVWRVPATFLLAMLVGATVGYAGWHLPQIEFGVAMSVILLGVAVMFMRLDSWRLAVTGAVAAFGFCHGHLHGMELPDSAAPLHFSFGFLLSSLFLHILGLFAAEMLSGARWRVRLRQSTGGAIAVTGLCFLVPLLMK